MQDIEKHLRAAKPAVPDLPPGFAEEVMARIETIKQGQLSTAGKVQKFPLLLGLSMLLLGALLMNSFSFTFSMSGSLDLLYFGSQFVKDVMEYLPWDLLIPAVIMTTLGAWMLTRSKVFKAGTIGIVLVSFLVTGVGGTALAATGINETVQTTILKSEIRWPVFSWFFREKAKYRLNHPRFRMGQVINVSHRQAWILNPVGEQFPISLPENAEVKAGDYIRLLGTAKPDIFQASQLRHCQPRYAKRYYCHLDQKTGQKRPMMRMHQMMHRGGRMD